MKEVNSVSDATNTYGEDIKLTTTDASTLYKTIITELEKGAGEPLYPGDERRIFGEALVPVFVAIYNSLNDVGRQTLLRYARGEVLDVVNAKDIRPLTDKVSAVPPEAETYDIEIVYYTTPESEAEVIANVEGTGGAIDRYNEWQVAALGRDINPDQLRKRILSPSWGENLTGAFRVDVVKPTYKALDDTQVAKFSGHLTVSHKVESEVV